jgi:cobalt-zinc-cadmium efflux system membrane fusion protein
MNANDSGRGWLRFVPALFVFLVLGGVAVVGRLSEWSLPKFSALWSGDAGNKSDWCEEHGVPGAICVECNPKEYPPPPHYGWCPVHGVHDCLFEHPELAQSYATPSSATVDPESARRALALKERPANSRKCKLHERRLQVASKEAMDKMGLDVMPVQIGTVVETVVASGELVYEQPSIASVAVLHAGRIRELTGRARLGAVVQAGEVLALLESPEVGKAKSDLLQAVAQLERSRRAWESAKALVSIGTETKEKLREAESALRESHLHAIAAQQTLLNLGLPIALDELNGLSPDDLAKRMQFLGLPESISRGLDPKSTSANLLPIKAPRAGVVIACHTAPGAVVDPTKTLFVIADTRRLWLNLHVRLEDVRFLRIRDDATGTPGQAVRYRPDGGGPEIVGELTWLSTEADDKTRTVLARAVVANPNGKLRANTFGQGRIVLREEPRAMTVPSEAIHWEGDCHIVFVQDKSFFQPGAPKVFHVRTVRPGVQENGVTEIIAGLLPGEVVVTRNSAVLRSQLLKAALGEGCGCCH